MLGKTGLTVVEAVLVSDFLVTCEAFELLLHPIDDVVGIIDTMAEFSTQCIPSGLQARHSALLATVIKAKVRLKLGNTTPIVPR